MIRQSIYPYFWFGTSLRYLQDIREGHPLGKIEDAQNGRILYNLDQFSNYVEWLNLQVTKRASNKLMRFFEELKALPLDAEISKEQATKLRDLIDTLRPTLEAEIEGFEAYVITPKRHDTKKLLEDVKSLLAPMIYEKLPDIARYDLNEAGKCVAFERPTAAAFHLLRGTECVLKEFYCSCVKQKRSQLMWGPMVANLRQRPKMIKKYGALIDNLDNIRRSFRNPTQHPEKIYDIQEVQDLWGLCVDVINRMVKDLP